MSAKLPFRDKKRDMWKFIPIIKTTIWGGERILPYKGVESGQTQVGECWEISGVPGSESVVESGPDAGLTLPELIDRHEAALLGKRNYTKYGNSFPLLIKILDASANLSIQVHPDDEMALRHHQGTGKSEMWYVLAGGPGVKIADGFKGEVSPSDIAGLVAGDDIISALNLVEISKGDVYYIPSGRVHALGSGAMVIEIQQTSDLTYRLYDFHRKGPDGKERELHVDLAREAIDYSNPRGEKIDYTLRMDVPTTVVRTPEFTTNILMTETEVMRDYSELDTFVVLICAEGEVEIVCGDSRDTLRSGNTILVPASARGLQLIPQTKTTLLETYVG